MRTIFEVIGSAILERFSLFPSVVLHARFITPEKCTVHCGALLVSSDSSSLFSVAWDLLHSLDYLVTRTMRWIVFRNVDIGSLARSIVGNAVEVVSAPNPHNGGRIIYFVKSTEHPETLVTLTHRYFDVSCHENLEEAFWDILDEECTLASGSE